MRRTLVAVFCAMLMLSSAIIVSVPLEIEAASGNTITVNVFDVNGPVSGAIASLTEVRKATAYADTSDSAGLLDFTPAPGYYSLKVSKVGYYDYTYGQVIRFDGLTNVNLGIVNIIPKGAPDTTLTFNVTSGSAALSGALVIVKINHLGDLQTMTSGSTNASGLLELDVESADLIAVISKANYVTKEVSFTALANMTLNVSLNASVSYSGTVTVNGAAASGVKVYMVDKNGTLSAPNAKILNPSLMSSNFFRFDAYPGNFYLLVDANNALGTISSITISSEATVTIDLVAQNLQNEKSSFAFADDDWNSAVQTKTLNLDYDYAVPGMAYSYLPSIRMQIDLALGNGNGVVEAAEVTAFQNLMGSYGPLDVTTENMMTVSSQMFISEDADPTVTSTGLVAAVDSATPFQMVMVSNYTSAAAITNALTSYSAKVTTKAATSSMGYTHELAFPSGTDKYEMVSNTTTSSTIAVSGFTTAVVKSGSAAGSATLTVQKSLAPIAAAAIVTSVNAYKVMNGSTLLHYIVAQDANVTFIALGSSDPNGNPLSYFWNFGDGNSTTVTTVTAVHAYDTAAQYTVNLTVTDKAGMVAYKSFLVKVDGVNPTIAGKQALTVLGTTLNLDQNKAYTFNSADSYDRLNATTEAGLIASYKWVWGDGNTTTVLMSENQTVTKTYARSGVFTMYLNVTDVANHTTSKAVTVTVKDTVKPTVKFSVKLNTTVVTSAKEFQNLTFDASASSDASGIASYLWDFGDGTNSTLASPVHSYSEIKTFTVKLTLTDNAGNVGNTTMGFKVESSARPDLRVGAVTFDPTKFTEGEDGYIYVNVTNVGTAPAEGIYGKLYKVNSDGTRKLLTDVSVLLVNDTEDNELQVGETGVLRFECSFESKGNHTLQIIISANQEVSSKMTDNSVTFVIEVKGRPLPGAPTGLTAEVGDGQADLSWVPPAGAADSAISHYTVYRDGAVLLQTVGNNVLIDGLTNGRTYIFTVSAHNSAGDGPLSAPILVTPISSSHVPDAPFGLGVKVGNGYAHLNWTAPANDGGDDIEHYVIYRDGTALPFLVLITNMNITGLTNGLTYVFEVTAVNSIGESARSLPVEATPSAVPEAPEALAGVGNLTSVALIWNSVPGAEQYFVYRQVSNGSFSLVGVSNSTHYLDEGLESGAVYSYKVSASNDVGEGETSTVLTVSTMNGGTGEGTDDAGGYLLPFVLVSIVAIVLAAMLVLRRYGKKG
ncbi:MAG: PKD domain-containing protein [Methanomassiliicoccales archaeon]|nr:PKD domain-containing protein [Methanomassiliicoccales archaeon]